MSVTTKTKNEVKYQYLAGACANIISISSGAFSGWPSASFLELQAEDSPLATGPMNNHEAGWVVSMLCVGGILGTVLFSWLAERLGRKRCLLLLTITSLIGWISIPFARTPLHLCISRICGGLSSGGSLAVIPIYVTELAQDSVRGVLGTFLILSCNAGILIVFVLGYFFTYDVVAWIMTACPILFFACFCFLPESPQHLVKINKMQKAEKALRYFRNLRRMSRDLPEHFKSELEKLKSVDKDPSEEDSTITWKDFNNHVARKGFLIGIALMALNQFCGCFAMLNYTATIFKESGSNMEPTVAAIVVAVIQLVGSYMSTLLVERAGRKLLLALSSIGTGIGLLCLGGYSYCASLGYDTSAFSWVPVASFSFTIFIACWGVLTLPFLVLSEILPPKIRNITNMICMLILWSFTFLVLKFLPLMNAHLGMHGSMFAFASCSFIGAVFVILVLPETKGKSIDAILAML